MPQTRSSDPQILRAIAHPLRSRILSELEAAGTLRAADVASRLHIPANQASFHLRQLARYGLVEEAPEAARDRRDRVWRPVSSDLIAFDLRAAEKTPEGRAAGKVFRRHATAWAHRVVDAAYAEGNLPEGSHRSATEIVLRLTHEEAGQLTDDLAGLVAQWAERTRGRGDVGTSYHLMTLLQPHPEDRA